ncbi:mitochondrial resolvase Ydc2 [Xylaria venustula]|nr:mitochondrial resolvase Ydc2 [Xylaria venustula]
MAASNAALGVIPQSLRAAQLKRLSFLCGLPVGGRKEELITRLTAAAAAAASPPSHSRADPVVLSIDLGIRNLAFSLMTPVSASAVGKSTAKSKKTRSGNSANQSAYLGTSPPGIKLHAWKRLSLLDGAATSSSGDGDVALEIDTPTETFSPAELARTANAFLQETVMQFKPLPTYILIERQRWRSGGAAAIQEWTVRVNTLEAMLHASLRTLHDVGIWKVQVTSVRPERVGQLFLDAENPDLKGIGEDETDASSDRKSSGKRAGGRKTSAESKKLKIELLGRWLGQGDSVIAPGNSEAGLMLDAYRHALLKGAKRSRSKRVAGDEETGEERVVLGSKLDDLTDSLLQGMAWLRWQENMALLRLENGVEQLLK